MAITRADKKTTKKATKKVVRNTVSAAAVKEEIDLYMLINDERQSRLMERVTELELAQNVGRPYKLPKLASLVSSGVSIIYWFLLCVGCLYIGYSLVKTDFVQNCFKQNHKDLSGNITEISQRYANTLVGNVASLQRELDALSDVIDSTANPFSELRFVIQYESVTWVEAISEAFQQGINNGERPSVLVKGIADGLQTQVHDEYCDDEQVSCKPEPVQTQVKEDIKNQNSVQSNIRVYRRR
jgi:hypothetical protein